ncbi:MAG: carbohydrate kinase [Verrucomicrobiaceae bacterium]|nr:carbohydrate kinase [Verrucomicrobiaceae bacterium]
MEKNLYLGIDASTQSLTGMVIDINSGEVFSASINFDERLPEYKTTSGVVNGDAGEVWSYPQMWVDALDMLFDDLSKLVDLSKIKGIGGAGQQHASVWLNSTDVFAKMSVADKGELSKVLKPYLSRIEAPVWLDTSTSVECSEVESIVGTDLVVSKTGSLQTERFTGAQIKKVFKNKPDVYNATKRIHLNSSFMCSVLCNADCPIDWCDGSGMNLLNLSTFQWDDDMLSATAPELVEKLALQKPMSVVGKIGAYFCKHYGFSPDVKVVVFTGDNPSSLIGIGASGGGNAVISLGTSDTFFCANKNYSPVAGAHVFGNPRGAYMNLACFRNGSLACEALKEELGIDWKFFDNSFEGYVPIDDSHFIMPYYCDEITPKISSNAPTYIGDKSQLTPIDIVRLFIEGQMFNMRLQAEAFKADIDKILLTGGASKSKAMAQCAADVFNSTVYIAKSSANSSALGGAMSAACVVDGFSIDYLEEMFASREVVAVANPQSVEFYNKKISAFNVYRNKLIEKNK